MSASKIRILIVDDSIVVRRLVSDVIASDPSLEVAGTAANGRIAMARIPQLNPDIVTMDVEMPEMDGLQTLAAIRKSYPRLPVIMFSTLTQRGASVTLEALTLGASDYVTKPANVGSVSESLQCLREQLVPKVKQLCGRTTTSQGPGMKPPLAPSLPRRMAPLRPNSPDGQRVDAVVIGVSTGGPNALALIIPEIPADFPVPVLIVQHMPPLFTRLLAERLGTRAAMPVAEGVAGLGCMPGKIWLAPGGSHMTVARAGAAVQLRLNLDPPENSCRPAVDVLFRAAAEVYGAGTLAVVLTGMGQDGLRGCERIREVGGQVIVQDEATSVVWGMPGFVSRAGLADKELPLDQITGEIVRRVRKGRAAPVLAATS